MDKKYQTIYADPPWKYNDKQSYNGTSTLGASSHYPTMSLEDICNLGIGLRSLMADDCVLFLWATSPLLPEAIEVIKAWGFKYKTLAFCWSKETVNGIKIANMGKWTMGNVELCLLGTRGHPHRESKRVRQLVEALREGHSKKPDEIGSRIVELMGDLPRIELFARQKVEGWDCWGNEVEGDIGL